MKKIVELLKGLSAWVGGLFKDEKGTPSSKRFVGVACALTLCITMYHNSFSTVDIAPAQYLVDAVALLAFGCLGLSSFDKFVKSKNDAKTSTSSTCETCGKDPCEC